jgi:hypothetical protein
MEDPPDEELVAPSAAAPGLLPAVPPEAPLGGLVVPDPVPELPLVPVPPLEFAGRIVKPFPPFIRTPPNKVPPPDPPQLGMPESAVLVLLRPEAGGMMAPNAETPPEKSCISPTGRLTGRTTGWSPGSSSVSMAVLIGGRDALRGAAATFFAGRCAFAVRTTGLRFAFCAALA